MSFGYIKRLLEIIKIYNIKNTAKLIQNIENLKNIIKTDCFFDFSKKQNISYNYELDNGRIFDFRKISLKTQSIVLISQIFWDIFENTNYDQIGTIEFSGVPLLMGIIFEGKKRGRDINGIVIRKDRKKRGFQENIEGNIYTENKNIIMIDDIINSGKTINYGIEILQKNGYNIDLIFSIMNFLNSSRNKYIVDSKISQLYFFDLNDFEISTNQTIKNNEEPIITEKTLLIKLSKPNITLSNPKSTPFFSDEYIYVAGEGGLIYCLDYSGNIKWEQSIVTTRNTKNILSKPIVIENYVIVCGYDGIMYFLDKNTGNIKNLNFDADWIGSSPCYNSKYKIIYVGMEHFGSKKGSLCAIDFDTGKIIWDRLYDDFVHCSPLYIDSLNYVIIGTNGGIIGCYDGLIGEKVWEIKINGAVKSGFQYNGNKLYFGGFDKKFHCVDIMDGSSFWENDLGNIVYSLPLIYRNEIFFGNYDNMFYHLNENGKIIFKYGTFGKIINKPFLIGDEFVGFGSNDCRIYFYSLKEKKVKYYYQHTEKINCDIYYNNNHNYLYLYDYLNHLWKIYLPKSILGIKK